jgi:2-keto-3-deoxy-galactonokinase
MLSAMTCARADGLNSFAWEYRILLIDASDSKSNTALVSSLRVHKKGIEDRKLKVILYTSSAASDAISGALIELDLVELKRRLENKQSILIGLDGGTKSFYDIDASGIDFKQVFADIDGMPMRRAELKR